jgi:hypothetical protein
MPNYGPYNQYQMPDPNWNMPVQRPPKYPELPRHRETSKWIHGILTVITGGLWAVVWVTVAVSAGAANAADKARYQREVAAWHNYQDRNR